MEEIGEGAKIGVSEGAIERALAVVPRKWQEGHLIVVTGEGIGIQRNPEFQEIGEVRAREGVAVRGVERLPQHSSSQP
tara:strand:+ start:4308 stop:4541 length:234 start_codon:yes stop_codon:yes gene_type:complete